MHLRQVRVGHCASDQPYRLPARQLRADFRRRHHTVKDTQTFPARARYPRHCGALCRTVPSEGCLLAAERMRGLLRAFAINLGAAAKIPHQDVVLALEPRRKEGAAVPA